MLLPQVQEVVSGGPAHACGVIEVGDQLLSIDGMSLEGKKPADISHLIVGPAVCTLLHKYLFTTGVTFMVLFVLEFITS